ncbi:vanadium-dependent haloperoxidase [Sphingomonas sp. Leaf62]|uniref:vanadium-dependent haloperoxidase n=1 Tax=Sphingomonas sp. Leaf62 TaxID=1736228 RepID=UPI0006F8DC88|nr:vanadium-dependent haloperoxidase [Sphingomonas sp. Leaf62]KQN77353.1 hypothetical protein ASE91_15300 [Sphingomonas sp. Leaf62]
MLQLPDVSHDEPDFEHKNAFPVFYWNHVALEMNRVTHSLGGPQTGPTMSSRAIGLLHMAMHDAFFATLKFGTGALPAGTGSLYEPYLAELRQPLPPPPGASPAAQMLLGKINGVAKTLPDANEALTGAAIAVLDRLYGSRGPGISAVAHQTLTSTLSQLVADYQAPINVLSAAHGFGEYVANLILARLAVKPGEPGADQGRFEPMQARYAFRDEPSNPVRRDPIDRDHPEFGDKPVRIYHGPFYGTTVATFAVSDDALHALAPPPVWHGGPQASTVYDDSLFEVYRAGGQPNSPLTQRTPDQTLAALFWAYDGANLIGTPPRLYNQVIRVVAWNKKNTGIAGPTNPATPIPANVLDQHAEFVRIFALCNAAMADAGKFAWREKYKFQLWRPLSGIREHDMASGPAANVAGGSNHIASNADPFWVAFGAPETNTNRITFKPPFPAYPSGHATFGAACFQMLRLFYRDAEPGKCDQIGFSLVSDEMNGISRDLYQGYRGDQPLADQPGLVRTRVVRRFTSLWHAIFENAFSRIWLGVHWNFDAFGSANAVKTVATADKVPVYHDPGDIDYDNVYDPANTPANIPAKESAVGGVPLGLGIANDIFASGLVDPRVAQMAATDGDATMTQPLKAIAAALQGEQIAIKATNTSTTQSAR